MRSAKTIVLAAALFWLAGLPAFPQAAAQEPKKAPAAGPAFSYDSGGRRDPFKDLFGGKTLREKKAIGGLSDLFIEDIRLMGIVKSKDVVEAIIGLTDGFPLTIREGDRLADGFVLSIKDSQVVFRKTLDGKGIPLAKPREIIKEIMQEER
jgi:Tfp pilus assembly protein PilP